MPSMTGAVTRLCVAAVVFSATADYTKTLPESARPNDGTFTRLAPTGTASQPWGDFTGRTAAAEDTKVVSDSLRLYLTEGDVSNIDLDVSDGLVVRIADTGLSGLARTVSDTLTIRATDAVFSLAKSGTITKAVSDTLTPVVAESVAYRVALSVSDTITPVVAEGHTLDKSDVKSVSDTLTPVLTEGTPLLSIFSASFAVSVSDTLRFVVTEAQSLRAAGEVDRIVIQATPKGRIRINRE